MSSMSQSSFLLKLTINSDLLLISEINTYIYTKKNPTQIKKYEFICIVFKEDVYLCLNDGPAVKAGLLFV